MLQEKSPNKVESDDDRIWDDKITSGNRRHLLRWGTKAAAIALSPLDASSATAAGAPVVDSDSPFTYESQIPFSSDRRYRTIKLGNGLRVLLVNDKYAAQASAALTINGAGQFADPDNLHGLAHLTEHMVLSYNSRSKFRKSRDFEDWLEDRDGTSNGFTAYDKVCFHFSCPPPEFSEGMERFAGLMTEENFVQVCQSKDILRREIQRVDSELDFADENVQSNYLLKSFVTPEHPYHRSFPGDLNTLERRPKEEGVNIAIRLVKFFRRYYLPSQAILVVVGPQDSFALERFVAPFATTLSQAKIPDSDTSKSRKLIAGGLLRGNRLKHIILQKKRGDADYEKISFSWGLNLDYKNVNQGASSVSAASIAFVLSQILCRRGPGSLYFFLLRRGWIRSGPNGFPKVAIPLDVSGFQLLRLEIPITLEGFVNRSAIVAALYDAIATVLNKTNLSRSLLAQYATTAKLHGQILASRAPDAVELAVDAQLFGLEAIASPKENTWYRFPSSEEFGELEALQSTVLSTLESINDPENCVIVLTAGEKARALSGIFDEQLPPVSSPKWIEEPLSGAKVYFDEMTRLSSRLEELVLTKLVDAEELQKPALNPLIPTALRPARIVDASVAISNANEKIVFPIAVQGSTILRRSSMLPIIGGSWSMLVPSPNQLGLQLPPGPPERTCRCAFVLQLLSPRPVRADVRQAARAELWRLSFEEAISDLAELGASGGLAYELTFNKFGLRIAILGISQTLPSYTRRLCRRLINHHFELFNGPEMFRKELYRYALVTESRVPGVSRIRQSLLMSNLRRSTAYEAASEGLLFLKSCEGAVCFAQGDLLPKEVDLLLGDLREIFGPAIGSSGKSVSATPSISDLVYKPFWKPRAGSPCFLPGASLMNDSCGRIPR